MVSGAQWGNKLLHLSWWETVMTLQNAVKILRELSTSLGLWRRTELFLNYLQTTHQKRTLQTEYIFLGHCSANKEWSKRNAASFKVISAVPHPLCRSKATSQLHLFTRRQNLFFPPGIRPYELVFTVSVSNRLGNLSTAAGDYVHTFVCCKLLGTYIFSSFQKQFLGAERQYWILLLAGKTDLTWTKRQNRQLRAQQQSWHLFCDLRATDNARRDSSHLPIPRTASVSPQISLVVQIWVTKTWATFWIWWEMVKNAYIHRGTNSLPNTT